MSYPFPQDEGYSEDPLTMRPGGSGSHIGPATPQWMAALPVEERARIAVQILEGLPTTIVEGIVSDLRHRLCLDFIERLPTEVCLRILSFLNPVSLINMALASRDAKALAFDWTLWENLYHLEGWRTIPGEVESFQQELHSRAGLLDHARPDTDSETERSSKKRATPQLVSTSLIKSEDAEMSGIEYAGPSTQAQSLFGGPIMSNPEDISMKSPKPRSFEGRRASASSQRRAFNDISNRSTPTRTSKAAAEHDFADIATLVTKDWRTGRQSLNWRHLYTQRRRLEANWTAGRFVNFQIPHPSHAYQAHSECIYTIQFQGRYLVSGSRDRSLRIWDMESRQLVLPPLIGHTGSVLCLQFDSDPEEDIIVSGSSDSSVILWKFSTGRAIQTLRHAHKESVLNVRFDRRILVTCSKDKYIKIFNRTTLRPGDLGYPVQAAVEPVPLVLNNYGFNPSPISDAQLLQPYSVIGVLEGHGAAVNAVQIWNDEIVSASGDRHVKVWNWPLQTCTRTLVGHNKGIACVQYDGRRIVSGSSDNEVKVFDKETGLEVASLISHSQLVRTVQAGFGDLPYSTEEDMALAKAVDRQYFEAVEQGTLPNSSTLIRGRQRNAGSSKPEHIMAYGAKLPPGGGGGQYGRIVSGSYDESIIIWRRDKEGAWKAMHKFKQEDAVRAAARQTGPIKIPPSSKPNTGALHNGSLPPTDPFYHHFIDKAVRAGPGSLRQLLYSCPALLRSEHVKEQIQLETDAEVKTQLQRAYNDAFNGAVVAGRLPRTPASTGGGESSSSSAGPSLSTFPLPASSSSRVEMPPHLSHVQLPPLAQQLAPYQATNNAVAAMNGQLGQALALQAQAPLPIQHPHPRDGVSQARVFKLQYDARRIVCCSQTPVIVAWDFANGDEAIVEACRFFGAVD